MSDFKFIVDTDKLNRQLMEHRMTTQESRRAIRNGLAAAGRIIRNAARDNLSNVSGKNGKINSSPLLRFVKFKVYRDCGGVRIDIFGGTTARQRASMSKKGIKDLAFTLKFFELGTSDRYNNRRKRKILWDKKLRKRRYTGRIQASEFFGRAVRTKNDEARSKLKYFIESQIERIAKKRR